MEQLDFYELTLTDSRCKIKMAELLPLKVSTQLNHIALRKTKIVYNFCLSEGNRVKVIMVMRFDFLGIRVA